MKRLVAGSAVICVALAGVADAQTSYYRYIDNGGQGSGTPSSGNASGGTSSNPSTGGSPSAGSNTTPSPSPSPTVVAADPVGDTDPNGVGLRYESVQGMVGSPFQATPVPRNITAGKAAYTLVDGTLPGTLTFDQGSGNITGTPSATGSYPLTVQVRDTSNGAQVAVPVTLSVIGFASVADALPGISYGGTDVTGYLADASTSTGYPTTGGYVTYAYDATRMADSINLVGTTGGWTLDGLSTTGAWTRLASGSVGGTFPFPAYPAQQYRLGLGSAYVQTAALLYQGATQVAPTVNPPAAQSISYGSGLGSLALSAGYLQGGQTWGLVGGALPDGITLAPAGTFSGTASRYGNFVAQVAVRDSRTQSAPAPLSVTVTSPYSAANYVPTSASAGSVAAFYDADTSADSTVNLSTNGTITFGFDRAVKVSGVTVQGSNAGFVLEYMDAGAWSRAVILGSGTTGATFGPYYASQWRVTSLGTASVSTLRLQDGGSSPIAPSVNAASVTAQTGASVSQALSAANATTPPALSYALASGSSWPTGLTMGTDGTISGSVSTATTTSVKVTVTDGRGLTSVGKTIPVTITDPVYAYAQWDPANKSPGIGISNGGLTAQNSLSAKWQGVLGTIGKSSGKWYYEVTSGLTDATMGLSPVLASAAGKDYSGGAGVGGIVVYNRDGSVLMNNAVVSGTTAFGPSAGTTIMIAWDGSKVWFGRNGTWMNGWNPATGTGGSAYAPGGTVYPAVDLYNPGSATASFQSTAFKYAPPAGFVPWRQ